MSARLSNDHVLSSRGALRGHAIRGSLRSGVLSVELIQCCLFHLAMWFPFCSTDYRLAACLTFGVGTSPSHLALYCQLRRRWDNWECGRTTLRPANRFGRQAFTE